MTRRTSRQTQRRAAEVHRLKAGMRVTALQILPDGTTSELSRNRTVAGKKH